MCFFVKVVLFGVFLGVFLKFYVEVSGRNLYKGGGSVEFEGFEDGDLDGKVGEVLV